MTPQLSIPLPSRRTPRSRLSGAFLIVCAFAAAVATKAEAYTFTSIADSAGIFSDFSEPSLNAAGTAAFLGALESGEAGIFSGSGGAITTVTAAPLAAFGRPTINDAGTVAFFASPISGNESILAGNGGPLTTIADTVGQFRNFSGGYSTAINAGGTVAFWARPDSGPVGIFAANGGTTTPLFITSPPTGPDANFTMNNSGAIASRHGNLKSIITFADGLITTIVDNSGPFNYFGRAPSINEAGTVVFNAGIAGIDGGVFGIYTGNGGALTTIADLSGPFSYLGDFNSYLPAINTSGTVAFIAGLDAGGGGLYIGDGTSTSEVIGSGDSLFGSTITVLSISPTSLNDPGQVAFYYELANGTTDIAVATPVPEPGCAALSFGGLLAILAPRRRRAQ